MESNSQILQLCRLCLDKDSVNIPIFEEHDDIRQIYLKISSCLPVKVSRDDRLPKKICDGCSHKLDLVYEFRNTSVSAEKQLLEWLEDSNLISETVEKNIEINTQQNRPTETQVKQEEIDPSDIQKEEDEEDDKNYLFEQSFQDSSAAAGSSATNVDEEEEEPPPPKRAKRTAAVKAAIAMDQSDDDDEDYIGEPLTKVEDESEDSEGEDQETPFVDVPSTSADDQPGPSGVGKEGEAPLATNMTPLEQNLQPSDDPLQINPNATPQLNFQTLLNGSLQLITPIPATNIPLGLPGLIIPSNNDTVTQLLMQNQAPNLQIGNLVFGPEIKGADGINQRLVLVPKNMLNSRLPHLTRILNPSNANNLIQNTTKVSMDQNYQGASILSNISSLGTPLMNLAPPIVNSSCASTDSFLHLPQVTPTNKSANKILVITPITPNSPSITAPSSTNFGSQNASLDTNIPSNVETMNVLLPSMSAAKNNINVSNQSNENYITTYKQSINHNQTAKNKKISTSTISKNDINSKPIVLPKRNTTKPNVSSQTNVFHIMSNKKCITLDENKTTVRNTENILKLKKNLPSTIETEKISIKTKKNVSSSIKQKNKKEVTVEEQKRTNTSNTNLDTKPPVEYKNPFDYSSYTGYFIKSSDSESDQNLSDQELDSVWRCQLCSETQNDKNSLIEHYEYHKKEIDKLETANNDPEDFDIECPACFTTFTSVQAYVRHINATHKDGTSICRICKKRFVDAYFLCLHNNRFHSSNSNIWICPLCNLSYTTPQEIRNHMTNQHDIKQDQKYDCQDCQKTFTSLSWFNNHKQFHIKNYPYECNICEKKFHCKSERVGHYKIVHNKSEHIFTKYQCNVCQITLPTKHYLQKHAEYHDKKPLLCNECGKILYCRDAMRAHMLRHEQSEMRYQCYTCGNSFKRKENLVVHMRIHTGHKPYKCKICGKRFNQRSPLRIHIRMHTGEKPYKCFRCKKGFASKGICDTHRRHCKK